MSEMVVNDNEDTFISIVFRNNKLGIACYRSSTAEILVGSTWEYSDFSIVQTIINEQNPSKIIAPLQQDESLKKFLDDKNIEVSIERNSLFDVKNAGTKLLLLRLPAMKENWSNEEKMDHISTFVCMDERVEVSALCGLLGYLLKNREVNQLEESGSPIQVNSLSSLPLDGLLLVDSNTLMALQIFKTELHPSVHQIGKTKEGLSLFGILNKCRTPVGKKLLREWFLRPIVDLAVLEARQVAVSHFLEVESSEILVSIGKNLRKFKDVPRILQRILSATTSVVDWCSLFDSILCVLTMSELIKNSPHCLPIASLQELVASSDSLEGLVNELNNTIHFDASQKEKRMIPKEGLDEKLDELRHVFDGLDSFLTEFAKEEFNQYDHELVPAIKCVYYPQIGFLVAVPILLDHNIREQIQLKAHSLEYQFHTGKFVFYKSPGVLELDQHIGDIYCSITDLESKQIRKLALRVISEIPALLRISKAVAHIDCLLSFALAAKDFQWKKPTLHDGSEIIISRGRHPLQEMCVEQFIPNDTNLENSVSILFGPNYSGKSVYMKQIGLICFMALLGSFVPAESASIGCIDRIMSRIHTNETSKCAESSFFIDLKQISNILHNATPRSLVLIDEFGKGTLPNDGISLMAATVRHLQNVGPKTLIGTHFTELQNPDIIPRSSPVRFLKMNHIVQQSEAGGMFEIIFLYSVSICSHNESVKSWGNHCAILAGLPESVAQRALLVHNSLINGTPLYPIGELAQEEEILDRFLNFDVSNGNISLFLNSLLQ